MRTALNLLLVVALLSFCDSFVSKRGVAVNKAPHHRCSTSWRQHTPSLLHRPNLYKPLVHNVKYTSLKALSDYSGAAQVLFRNIITPAALLAGALVPLGFLAPLLPGDKPRDRRIRSIYCLLSVISLANELTAIAYATVASNKLTEIEAAPAASVICLIKRDYELSWIATNVHVIFGLFGFLSMIGLRAYTTFPRPINTATAGVALSALFGMCSVVNRGVVVGGPGDVDGMTNNIVTLVFR